jgi:hypothetical protein
MFWIAGSVVVAFGLWLIGLAAFILVAPARAGRFLMGFASSARAHYAEQGLRLIVGTAVAIFAPMMMFPALFRVFGWLIVLSTLGLLLLPWRWHRRFARRVMPPVVRHGKWFAVASFILGAFVLFAAIPR